jgi:hypothetical protein
MPNKPRTSASANGRKPTDGLPAVAAVVPSFRRLSRRPTATTPSNASSASKGTATPPSARRSGSTTRTNEISRADFDVQVANAMSEAAWQAQIVSLATSLRYLCYHTRDSRGSERGFPDLTILGVARVLLMELKRQAKRLTAEQVTWLDALARLRDSGNSGVEIYGPVRPMDREALVLTFQGVSEDQGGLHQWDGPKARCPRCDKERARALPSRPLRQRTPRRTR